MKFSGYRSKNGSWGVVAKKYDGIVGTGGSVYHRESLIPKLIKLLGAIKGKKVIDVGCGQGFLSKEISQLGADYLGVDISREMIQIAQKRFGKIGKFYCTDAAYLENAINSNEKQRDWAIFLLSISDMPNLDKVIRSVSPVLKEDGQIAVFMLHPCFRIPRQSGWGVDEKRRLRFRRIDSYLLEKNIPMGHGETTVFFRPLSYYINTFAKNGWQVLEMQEIATDQISMEKNKNRMEKISDAEIPMFLGLRLTRSMQK